MTTIVTYLAAGTGPRGRREVRGRPLGGRLAQDRLAVLKATEEWTGASGAAWSSRLAAFWSVDAPNPQTARILRLHQEEGLGAAQIAQRTGWFDADGQAAVAPVRKRLRRAG